jgi:hypothetical protein
MNLRESLYRRLVDDAGVSAIAGTKVFPLVADQDAAAPFVVYQIIAGAREHTMVADSGPQSALVQVASWSTTHTGALELAAAVSVCLKDFSGTLGGSGGVTVQRIFEETEVLDEHEEGAEVEGLWVGRQEFTIWYE